MKFKYEKKNQENFFRNKIYTETHDESQKFKLTKIEM